MLSIRCLSVTGVQTLVRRNNVVKITTQHFSLRKTVGGRNKGKTRRDNTDIVNTSGAPAPASAAGADPWVSVLDKASGQIYWWNQTTNETTGLGAVKPTAGAVGPVAQKGSMMGGLAGVVAEGMAFGVGSAIAHRAVGAVAGSLFGGGSSDHGDVGGGGGDGGEWDI